MGITRSFVFFLLVSIATNAWSHHHHHHNRHGSHAEHRKANDYLDSAERKSSFENEKSLDLARSESSGSKKPAEVSNSRESVPFSARRLEKMLEKAILKIIMGDLGTAEMLLLKSLNYTPEEVLTIRERELDKRKDEELRRTVELKSNGRKLYGEDLYGGKAKHWNYNSMEFDSSSRNEPDVDVSRSERKRNRYKEKTTYDKDFDFDAYNRQAVIDYENLASKLEQQQPWSEPASSDFEDEIAENSEERDLQNFHRSFDRAMEPHVIFKIPYDDSEFDSSSSSEERSKLAGRDSLVSSKGLKHYIPSTLKHTIAKNVANSFHTPSLSAVSSSPSSSAAVPSASAERTSLPVVYQLGNFQGVRPDYQTRNQSSVNTTESPQSTATSSTIVANVTSNATSNAITDSGNSTSDDNSPVRDADAVSNRNISEYEGLEWIEDDVYRVIPSFADSLAYEPDDNETSDYAEQSLNFLPEAGENDTLEYQNDTPDPVKLFMANVNASIDNSSTTNLSTYQQLALAHRREENVTTSFDSQGQKAIEDIKTRVLALTGRFNLSTNTNQVQRERLTMFSPTCQIPRNTDSEAWMDPFSMNMHFQLNLTSGDHVIAAKLRIYKLPQANLTVASASGGFDEDEDDEKKIRISIYYYTKSLKKHRSKKRLMDSVVTPLTVDGTHLALDVRQGLRFWLGSPRLASRNPHGNGSNHGLVIQIEDQDGRPLKPALYVQQPSCEDHNSDQKASQRTPALFVRACPRYVRIVNGEKITYVNCRH